MPLLRIFNKKCSICKRKISPLRTYIDDNGKKLLVCLPCSEYAERRAYKRKG
ncbi:hypothetical protein [Metabacillus niabensis]|uniref:Ribosome-binding protein aMBF1 (Putative translation factor) n=1 Tax=Metabacillus niabensis TaxID=324854 RepID=A0ABT9Z1B4_9BACI|nr:hypothetical protein [Metabacillus niabensis]MDQ0226036.1 ribosome-binding protein aMBF1 (putative translation factor) [Metabacillus niabensis]